MEGITELSPHNPQGRVTPLLVRAMLWGPTRSWLYVIQLPIMLKSQVEFYLQKISESHNNNIQDAMQNNLSYKEEQRGKDNLNEENQ